MAGQSEVLQLVITARDQASGVIQGISGQLTSFEAAAGKAATGIATAFGVIAAALTAISAVSFAKFESDMAYVNTIAEQTKENLAAMGDEVLAMVGKVNKSASDLASGLYQVYSSNFTGAEAFNVLEKSAKAAAAGMTDTKTAVTAVTAVLNAYSLGGDQAARVSDFLFNTVNRGIVKLPELSNNIGNVIGIAGSLGIKLEELGASISTITKRGYGIEEASTMLNRVLTSFLKPSDAMVEALHQIGYESGEAAIKQDGLAVVLKKLHDLLGEDQTALNEVFDDIRGAKGATALMSDGLKMLNDDIDYFNEHATGSTEAAFSKIEETITAKLEKIKNTFQAALIGNFESQGSWLNGLLDSVQTAMPQITALANELVNALVAAIKVLLDLASGISTLWNLIPEGGQQAILIIGGLTVAFFALNAAMKANPVLAVVAAFAALVGIIGQAVQAAVPFAEQMEKVRKTSYDATQAEGAADMARVSNYEKAKRLLQELADLQGVEKTPDVLQRMKDIGDEINKVFPDAKIAIDSVTGAVTSALGPLDAVYTKLQSYIDKIKELREASLQAKLAELENAKGELSYWDDLIASKGNELDKQKTKIAQFAAEIGIGAIADTYKTLGSAAGQMGINDLAEALGINKEARDKLAQMITSLQGLQGEFGILGDKAIELKTKVNQLTGAGAADLNMLSQINLGGLVSEFEKVGFEAQNLGDIFPTLAKGFDEAISQMVVSFWQNSGTLWEAADTTFSKMVTILTDNGVAMNDAMEIAGHGIVQSLINQGVPIDEATKYVAGIMKDNGYQGGVDYSGAIQDAINAGMGGITAAATGAASAADMGDLWWSIGWNQGASYIDGIAESIASAAPALSAGSILAASYAPVKKVEHVPLAYYTPPAAGSQWWNTGWGKKTSELEPPPGSGGGTTPSYTTLGYPTVAGAALTPTATFGEQGPYWGAGGHRGLDIAASMGDAVTAIGEGVVTAVKNEGSWGNIVEIMLKNGIRVLYAHLQDQLVKVGDKVSQGDWLGTVGMTGTTTGPHLHIETSINTDPLLTGIDGLIDPLTVLGQTFEDTTDAAYGAESAIVEGSKKLYEHKYAIETLAPTLQTHLDQLAALQQQTQDTGDSTVFMANGQKLIDAASKETTAAVNILIPRMIELAATGQSGGDEYKYLSEQLKTATTDAEALTTAQKALNQAQKEYQAMRAKTLQDQQAVSAQVEADVLVRKNKSGLILPTEYKTVQEEIIWQTAALAEARARLSQAQNNFIRNAGGLEESSDAWKVYRQDIDDAQAAIDQYTSSLEDLQKKQKSLDEELTTAMKPDEVTRPYESIGEVIDSITAKWKNYTELVKQGAKPTAPEWNTAQQYLLANVGNIMAELGIQGAVPEIQKSESGAFKSAVGYRRPGEAASGTETLKKYDEEAQKRSLQDLFTARGWQWNDQTTWKSFQGLSAESQSAIMSLAQMQEAQDKAKEQVEIQKKAADDQKLASEKQLTAGGVNNAASKIMLTASQQMMAAAQRLASAGGGGGWTVVNNYYGLGWEGKASKASAAAIAGGSNGGGSPFHNVYYDEGGIASRTGLALIHAGEIVLPPDFARAIRIPLPSLSSTSPPPSEIPRPPVQVGDVHIHDAPAVDRRNIREIAEQIMAEIDRRLG